jgi:hypothetical protein
MPKPSLGRIIHYVGDDGGHRSAIVVAAFDDPRSTFYARLFEIDPRADTIVILYTDDEGTNTGQWHWPERVDS